jgi:hypothetical protein
VPVGLERVEAVVLQDVSAQLVEETDAAALVADRVEQHATALGCDHAQRGSQLDAAVAARRAERVARQALGMQAGQHAAPVAELALDEHDENRARHAREGAHVELARGGRE